MVLFYQADEKYSIHWTLQTCLPFVPIISDVQSF